MSQARRQTGQQGEAVAAAHLGEQGYRIIDRNYRCRFGEIDLIALEGETLVFIEVKCRRSDAFGPP
ncbi:MAG: YraN family protein, partial [Syntrophaceae bacterium]|nr:YraN family protein [Syntrophaceae bacterium]